MHASSTLRPVLLLLVTLLIVPAASLATGSLGHSSGAPSGPAMSVGAPSALAPSSRANPSAGYTDVWTEYQHDSQNTGASSNSPVRPGISWNDTLSAFDWALDAPYVASPAVGMGDVYLPEGDTVVAYNASTGAVNWTTPLTGPAGAVVDTTPLLWNGVLVVGEDNGAVNCGGDDTNNLYVLDAVSGKILATAPIVANGDLGWYGNALAASPIPLGGEFAPNSGFSVTDRCGVVSTYDWDWGTATLTAVGTDAAVRQGFTRTTSTPSVAFVPGLGWGEFFLDALGNQRLDGVALSNAAALPFLTGYPVDSGTDGLTLAFSSTNSGSIAIANVSGDGPGYPVAFFGDNAGVAGTSLLTAFNLSTPATLATGNLPVAAAVNSGVLSAPAIQPVNSSDVILVVSDLNGSVSGWNFYEPPKGQPASLKPIWQDALSGTVSSSPSLAGGVAYIGDPAGKFFALDVVTGAIDWSVNLGETIYGSAAIAYQGAYLPASPESPAVGNLVAFGPPTIKLQAVALPPQIASGGTSMIVANATSLNLAGATVPVAGASVHLTSALGTASVLATTDANGFAYLNWTAPPTSPVWYNATLLLTASSSSNLPGSTPVVVEVAPGTTGGTGGPKPLALALAPPTSILEAGATVQLNATVASSGSPVANAVVSFTVTGPGTLSAPSALSNAMGLAWDNYTAPSPGSVTSPLAVLVSATTTLRGYGNGSAASAFDVLPPSVPPPSGKYSLEISASPAASQVDLGATETLTVSLANASSSLPVAGLDVSASLAPASLGAFTPTSVATDSSGDASFTFKAGTTAGAALASFTVDVFSTNYVATFAAASLAVVAPPTVNGKFVLVAAASPASANVPLGSSQTIEVTLDNASSGLPASDLWVAASLSSVSQGTFQAPVVEANATGVASFTYWATGSLGAELATFTVNVTTTRFEAASASMSLDVTPSTSDGWLALSVSPSSASPTIWVDGSQLTGAAASNETLAPGMHSVEVTASGYAAYFNNVSVATGRTTTLAIALQPLSKGSTSSGGSTIAGTGLTSLELLLLFLVIILAAGLVVALATRRKKPSASEEAETPSWSEGPPGPSGGSTRSGSAGAASTGTSSLSGAAPAAAAVSASASAAEPAGPAAATTPAAEETPPAEPISRSEPEAVTETPSTTPAEPEEAGDVMLEDDTPEAAAEPPSENAPAEAPSEPSASAPPEETAAPEVSFHTLGQEEGPAPETESEPSESPEPPGTPEEEAPAEEAPDAAPSTPKMKLKRTKG